MKNIAITCFVLIAVCVGLQAKKVVKAPYFMATNTSQIEFEKVTLGKDTTWIDAKIYSIPGEDVRIDSTAVLQIGGKTYARRRTAASNPAAQLAGKPGPAAFVPRQADHRTKKH